MAAQPVGFFGLKLVPGEVKRLDVTRDFRLTNVSFADEVKAGTRALVKVHYTMPPEFDSDEEDEDDEKSVQEPEEKTYTLCTLVGGKTEQAVIDLQFSEEEEVGFSITGSTPVDLVGNYVAPPDFYDQDPDSDEFDSDDEYDSDIYGDVDMEDNDDDDDDDDEDGDEDRFEEIVETPSKKNATPAKKAIEAAPPASASKKRAAEEDAEEARAAKLNKNEKKKVEKKEQQEASAASSPATKKASTEDKKSQQQPKASESTKKTTLPSGLIIEEKTKGTGPQAKAGQKVGMRYVGKLTNGKIFDQCIKGKPFTFKLGRGEVIKGWDEGVKGMQVGSERRLICPPKLAYGNQKIPGIPPNSTLVFDVKLVEIK